MDISPPQARWKHSGAHGGQRAVRVIGNPTGTFPTRDEALDADQIRSGVAERTLAASLPLQASDTRCWFRSRNRRRHFPPFFHYRFKGLL